MNSSQLILGLVLPYLMQWLKGQPWFPALGFEKDKLNRIVTALVAALSAAGVMVTFNHATLTVSGLTLANLWTFSSHAFGQWALQHTVYKAAISPAVPGAVQDMQRKSGLPNV